MSENSLTDLNGIQFLKNLKNLVFRKNNISKIDHIDGLSNLVYLDLSFNKLRVIERGNIGILPNIKTLLCDGNYLKNVNSFAKLQGLNFISMENNKISEYSMIEKISLLENLTDLNISNNPICKFSGYRANIIKKFTFLNKLDNQEISKEEKENIFIEHSPQSSNFFNNFDNMNHLLNNINVTKTDLRKVIFPKINLQIISRDIYFISLI